MLINDDGLTPNLGEDVICDMCGKTYEFFIWAFGSNKHLCKQCVQKTPSAALDNIDSIDIDKEYDIISEEISEQDQRDFPRVIRCRSPRKKAQMSKYAYNKMMKIQDKSTIKKFKQFERSAIDVTGLG